MTAAIGYLGTVDDERKDVELLPLASTRRTMLADPAYLGVHGLLAPLVLRRLYPKSLDQAREELAGQVRRVEELLGRSRGAEQALAAIAGWLSRPIRPELADLFRHACANRLTATRVLVSTFTLRALWIQRISPIRQEHHLEEVVAGLARPQAVLDRAAEAVGGLPEDFLGYLAVEAAMRARHDPRLAVALEEAVRQLGLLAPAGRGRRELPSCVAAGISILTRHVTICSQRPPAVPDRRAGQEASLR